MAQLTRDVKITSNAKAVYPQPRTTAS